MKSVSQQEEQVPLSKLKTCPSNSLQKQLGKLQLPTSEKRHISNYLVSTALLTFWERFVSQTCLLASQTLFSHSSEVHLEKHLFPPSSCNQCAKRNLFSNRYNISLSIITIYIVLIMKLQGLIMKGRCCQSLNSDFPVVSSLSSITSFFVS